jgi:hypothetical protein
VKSAVQFGQSCVYSAYFNRGEVKLMLVLRPIHWKAVNVSDIWSLVLHKVAISFTLHSLSYPRKILLALKLEDEQG